MILLWRLTKWTVGLGATVVLLGMLGAVGVFWHYSKDLPDAAQLRDYAPPVTTRVYAADGQLIGEFSDQNRIFVPIQQVPERVIRAFTAAEDQRFYEHSGVDFFGVVRAISANILHGERLVGASTITQQVAKNFLVGDERSFERKIREALLSFRIEDLFTKDEILELYLNEIPFGGRIYGIASASLNYFDKPLNELTVAEAAYLAALPKAPTRLSRNDDLAIERRNYVIGRMVEDGSITGADAEVAYATPIETVDRDPSEAVPAEYFVEEVRRQLVADYGDEAYRTAGLTVRTTLEPDLQAMADQALRFGLSEYDRRHGYRGPIAAMENFDNWPEQLSAIEVPAGTGDWQLAVVLEVDAELGQLGFADRRRGLIGIRGLDWAAPWLEDQRVGNAPSRVTDVLEKGDVILVSPRDAEAVAAYDAAFDRAAAGETVELPEPPPYKLEQIPDVGGGIVVMDPHTGRVLAMSGGWDYWMSNFNRATQAYRQPGSSFKPFVYLAAMDDGFTPASIILDSPFVLDQGPGMAQYRPNNYSGQTYGPLPLFVGLEKSRNLMTVRLAYTVGMDRISQYARLLGIDEDMEPYLSMALGAGETTVMRLVGAYSQVVNGGRHVTPTLIDRIQDRRGYTLPQSRQDRRVCSGCQQATYDGGAMPLLPDARQQIADPRTTFQVVTMLRGVVARGTGSRLGAALPGYPLGGKTGTTDDGKDTWFVGFTPDLVVGAYIGFDQPKPLGASEQGGRTALPIVQNFLEHALAGTEPVDFRPPEGLIFVPVGHDTGLRSESGDIAYMPFIPGTEPTETQHSPRSAVVEVSATGAATATDIMTGTGGLYGTGFGLAGLMSEATQAWRRTIEGVDVRFVPATDSTQDDLRALIAADTPHLTMVSAGEQRNGRGRSGRSWASPPGNLYTSTLLRPRPGWSAPLHATFVAALAVAETVDQWADPEAVQIKWPNDVLVAGGKIAGVLLEAGNARATPGGGHEVDWLALGVGVNVGSKPERMPYPTACLAELSGPSPSVDAVRERFCAALVAELAAWERHGFTRVRARVLARMVGVGDPITVRLGDRPADLIQGVFRSLNADGMLLLETASGQRSISSGDVMLQGRR